MFPLSNLTLAGPRSFYDPDMLGPRSCYDEGKRVGETIMFDYHRMYNTDIKVPFRRSAHDEGEDRGYRI